MLRIRNISFCGATVALLAAATALPAAGAGLVAGIQKAWVVPDGDVTGEAAVYVITLSGSLDPAVRGRSLTAGDQIRVIFPAEFDLTNLATGYPLADVPTPSQPCVPTNLQCTTAVLLKGWPEEPYFPPAQYAKLSIDSAENALVFTAVQDIVADPPVSPGIKQLFLMLHGVTNPSPGYYRIRVDAQTGPAGSWESGSGFLQVLPQTRPSIGATSVFVKALSGLLPGGPACGPGTLPPNPDDPVYQTTAIESNAPFVWSFLLWGDDAEPLGDVWLDWVNSDHALLKRVDSTIGHVFIDAPRGATGQAIEVNPLGCPTVLPAAPVIGGTPGIGPDPVGRLDMQFRAGNVPGRYTTTIVLNNGSSQRMIVTALRARQTDYGDYH
jgi:hypothetical protein